MVNLSECVKQQTDRRGSVLHSSTPICSSSSSHSEEEVQKSREQWANMSNSLLFYSSALPPFFPIQGVEGVEAGALPGKDGYHLVLHHEEQTVWVTLKKIHTQFLKPFTQTVIIEPHYRCTHRSRNVLRMLSPHSSIFSIVNCNPFPISISFLLLYPKSLAHGVITKMHIFKGRAYARVPSYMPGTESGTLCTQIQYGATKLQFLSPQLWTQEHRYAR